MFIDFNVKLIYNEMHNSYMHFVLLLKNAYWNNFDIQSLSKKKMALASVQKDTWWFLVVNLCSHSPEATTVQTFSIYLLNLPFFMYCITIIIQFELFFGLLLWHTVMFLRFTYSFRLLCISIIPFVLPVVFHYITIPQFG